MRRRTATLTVLGGLGAIFSIAALVQYPSYRRAKRDYALMRTERRFAGSLDRELRRGDGARLDLDALIDVAWDRMYVLRPYTTFESARGSLPGPWYLRDHDGLDARD